MPEIIRSTEGGLEEGERRAERDLGAVIERVDQLIKDVADHATTIEGIKGDRQWITERLEAIERDLAAIPKIPEDLTSTLSSSIANLTERLERLEAATIDDEDEHTRPPHRDEHRDGDEDGRRREEKRPTLLDRLF